MGRNKLTAEQIIERYQDLKETLDELKQKRADSNSDEEKNEYTKKISLIKRTLHQHSRIYRDRIPQQVIKEPKQQLITTSRPTLKAKFKEIEEKANKLLQQTTDPTERQSILERLEACRLRLKYSY